MRRLIVLQIMFLVISGNLKAQQRQLIDSDATIETRNLFNNLFKISQSHTLFGHQHATEYGRGWAGESNRSDVKSVTGSHPAVIGVDISGLSGKPKAEIERNKRELRGNVLETFKRGGVTTVSWHFSNPVSGGGFYWKDSVSLPAVRHIIPSGRDHQKYKLILNEIADWAKSLKTSEGDLVPVIFRPYHEFDGDWFWWGAPHCTKAEFVELWRFTVSYLRDSSKVHNFIYAFSPDSKFKSEAEYLDRYPGNQWVDLLGTDNYGDMGRDSFNISIAASKLKIVSDLAMKNGKLAAFTETGLEGVPHPKWWTDVLLKVIKKNDINISYVLVWRNDTTDPKHYYAPYPGQISEKDFVEFYKDPFTLFENDLGNIYDRDWKL